MVRYFLYSNNFLENKFVELNILRNLWVGNIIIFIMLIIGALFFFKWQYVISVTVGGLIALVNFRLLELTIYHALLLWFSQKRKPLLNILVKYYLRIGIIALVLRFLVKEDIIEPVGLVIGLSVVILTVVVFGAIKAKSLIF